MALEEHFERAKNKINKIVSEASGGFDRLMSLS